MTYLATVTGFFFIVSKNPAKKQKQTQQKHKKMKLNESKQKLTFIRCHIQKPCPHKTGFAVTQCQTSAISFCQQQKKETHKKINVITRSYMYYLTVSL